MNSKKLLLLTGLLFCSSVLFAQINTEQSLQLNPYIGMSTPQEDFKNFSKSGYVLGLSLDKYISSKFGLGIDFNYQSHGYKNSTDYSIISNPYSVSSNISGDWSSTNITFGPTYKFGTGKINTEIYAKGGISMVQSPSEEINLTGGTYPSFTIFRLDAQKVTSFGITTGLRFNYPISKNISLYINPQYIYSSSEINYLYKDPSNSFFPTPDGADPVFEPGMLDEEPEKEGFFKPSYFNLNAGLKISFGTPKKNTITSNINRNLPICDILFVNTICDGSVTRIQFTKFWNNFDTTFSSTVEIFNGSASIVPASSPQNLIQNNGVEPFYATINNNLIGTTLTAVIKIYDANGILKCETPKTFIVAPCSPQPPSCNFNLDIENVECDANFITYAATGNWANLNPGNIIDIIAKDQQGNPISITLAPNPFPISITTGNASGNFTGDVSIPFSYNGTSISIMLKITDPTTGQENLCGFTDSFTPICEPASTICDWEYIATCDPINKGIKIDVTSSWSNAPVGSTLRYKLINLNGGANIPFTFSPNNLPQNIVTNGSSTHTIFINSSFSGAQAVFKMEIFDANGVLLCNKGIDLKLPSCVFEACELVELEARCDNEQPFMAFSVDWNNYSNYSNYSIYLEAKDENGNPVAWFNNQTFPPFQLTGVSGSAPFSMPLFPQYAGTTITIFSKICETGTNKDCCVSVLKIDIPKCCEDCSGINDIKDTTDVNQTNIVDFVFTGVITQSNPTPISKVVAQLEAIKFQPINNNPLTISNFEFTRSWFANGGSQSAITTGVAGSVTGNRSNLIITEINPPSATNMIFRLNVDNYNYGRDLRVEFYKVKLTIFKDDGTYCEKFISYQR